MAGISETSSLMAGRGYDQTINFRLKVDRKFKIPKDCLNEYCFEEGSTPKSTEKEPVNPLKNKIGSFHKTKLDPAFNVSTEKQNNFSNVTERDLLQYNEWREDNSKTPDIMSNFKSVDEYIEFMDYYRDSHLTLDVDPAVIKSDKMKRTFSITNDEVYEFTTDLLDGSDFGSVIGSVMYSVTFAHFYHLCTKDYPAHMALDDYYNEMPEKIDALAEHFLGENTSIVFGNAIQPGLDPIQYFEELKDFVISFEDQLEPAVVSDIDSYKSQIDDITNLISSTLYKLKRLATPKRTFSTPDVA